MNKIKCTKVDEQERFFTKGKEYTIFHNEKYGYFINFDDDTIAENAETVNILLLKLEFYWWSKFELVDEKQ